jgi:hypothetical protein
LEFNSLNFHSNPQLHEEKNLLEYERWKHREFKEEVIVGFNFVSNSVVIFYRLKVENQSKGALLQVASECFCDFENLVFSEDPARRTYAADGCIIIYSNKEKK